jgi:hypothetical protein
MAPAAILRGAGLLMFSAAVGAQASGDGLPRGWDTAPYVRYEAEHALRGGGATDRTAFDFDPANTAVEASGRHYVGLPATGSHLEWAVTNAGSGLTLRFTLPDNASGAGVAGSLDLYVNGTNTVTVDLSSYWAWTYFVSSNPRNTPGVRPRMRFDEIHLGLPAPLQPGDVVRLQKNITDAFEYGIDFLEVEPVPLPLAQPPGYVSVASHGANGGDSLPDSAAFKSAWQAAVAAGTGLYVPPGRYLLTNQWNLGASTGIGLQGAGIWHTELHFPTKAVGGGGLYVAEGTHGLDISHFFMSSVLNERYLVPGVISDYKAFNGSFGNNSRIHDLWITHFETGAWLADETSPVNISSNFLFASNRVRNTYADGVNFSQGTRNSTVMHCSFRDNGDDALAVWPSSKQGAPEGRHNTFHHNTIEFTYRAGGIGIFGGFGHEAHHNIIRDGTDSAGIRFTEDFPGYHFQNNPAIRIFENTISGRGTSLDLWNLPRGAIEISGAGIRNLFFDHNDILDSPRHAIQLRGGTNLFFSNTTIQVTGLDVHQAPGGAAVRQYDLGGGATFAYLFMSDIENDPPIVREVPSYFLSVLSEFPFTEASTVRVPEGDTAALGVRLSFAPAGVVTVAVSRTGGDTDLTIASGTSLLFNASNWTSYQPVVFAAAPDPDVADGTGTFRCAAAGFGETTVTAVEFDDDVNHPPVAAADHAATDEDEPVPVAVLTNDVDPDGDTLSILSVSAASQGTVGHDGTTASYTPAPGFHGFDAFTYVAGDGRGGLATGRVDVTVQEVVTPNPYRMELRFPGYIASEPLSNFPVLIQFGPARPGFAYGQFASRQGYDLRFTDESGTVLNYEADSWDTGGVSAVWVQVPHFTNNCRIEASWGSADNAQQADYTTNGAAWSGGFAAVYHAGGPGSTRRDSAADGRDGQAFGDTAGMAGRVAQGDQFDGNGDYVELPSTFALFNGMVELTVEFWFQANALASGGDWNYSPVLFQGNGESAWMVTLGDSIPTNAIGNRVDQGGWATPVSHAGIDTGRWYHCTSTYTPTGTANWKLYLDGMKVSEASRSGLVGFLTEKNMYGGNNVGIDRWFDGAIDEVRISRVARSTNWIRAGWLSVVSNEVFTSYGTVQGPAPAAPPLATILVDFGNDLSYRGASVANPDSNGRYWNSVWSGAYYPGLVDSSNQATTIGLGFDAAVGTDSYNGPSNAVDPDALGLLGGAANAVNDYYVNTRFQVQGLDTGRTYTLTFFGSHKYSEDDATVYSVYGDSAYTGLVAAVSLLVQTPGAPALHNSNRVAVVTNLVPQAGNALYVEFQGANGHNGYLNAMQISAYAKHLTYEDWALGHPGLGVWHADDDGDGLANLAEFGFGGNPTNPADTGYPITFTLGQENGTSMLTFAYARRTADSGLGYHLEHSTNLLAGSWVDTSYSETTATGALNAWFESVTNRLPADHPGRFIRIVVEE